MPFVTVLSRPGRQPPGPVATDQPTNVKVTVLRVSVRVEYQECWQTL